MTTDQLLTITVIALIGVHLIFTIKCQILSNRLTEVENELD